MAPDFITRITADLTAAMKSRDAVRTSVLRGLKSDLKYREIEKGAPLTEAECQQVLRSAQKKRRDSIDAFERGGRADLVSKEKGELAIITEYLPAELPEEELVTLVREAIAEAGATVPGDLGKVMKPAMTRVAGRAEGNRVRQVVADQLQALAESA